MKDELYINGKFIELDESEPVGFTYQVYDIAQLQPQAAYSNSFQIPETNNNDIALNFSNTVATNTLAPYRQLPCTFIRGGVQIVSNGVAIIESSQGGYQVTIYSAIYNFYQQLGDLSLKDIDWSYLNHNYDMASIDALNTAWCKGLSPISWPLINWGNYVANTNVDIRYQQAALNFSEIINKIFAKTTYTKSGEIFGDGIYKDLAITLNPDEYPVDQSILDARSYKATINQTITDLGIGGEGDEGQAPFFNLLAYFADTTTPGYDTDLISLDTVNPFRVATDVSWAPPHILNKTAYKSTAYQTIDINIKLTINNAHPQEGFNYYVVRKNGRDVYKTDIVLDGANQFFSDFTIDLIPGDIITVILRLGTFVATGDIGQPIIPFTINATNLLANNLSITSISSTPFNSLLNYNYLVPGLKLKDIITSFCQQFALIITPSDNDVRFTKFLQIRREIINVEDWSDKIDLPQVPAITYRIDPYSQNNNLRYLADPTTNGFGDSSFQINDQVIPTTIDLFQLIYPSSLPVENIFTTDFKFVNLPVQGYFTVPQWKPYIARAFNDRVGYNNIVYKCISPLSSADYGQLNDSTIWQVLVGATKLFHQYNTDQPNEGIVINRYTLIQADQWIFDKTYGDGDQVNYGGIIYQSRQDVNLNKNPQSETDWWQVIFIQYEQTISNPSHLVLLRPISRVDIPGYLFGTQMHYSDGESSLLTNSLKYPMAYFSDVKEPYNLTFTYLIENYWKEFTEMLNQLKVVEVLINLTDLDILELNFFTLKYISFFNNHFYLTTVEEYLQGQSTKCRLIRM